MVRITVLAAITLLVASCVFAQPANQWFREYGNEDHDEGWAICATSDNCFVFAGKSLEPTRLSVTKVDEYGNQHWQRTAQLIADVRDIAEAADGGFVLVGSTGGNGFVAKLDLYGNLLWHSEIAPGAPIALEAVTIMPGGDIVVTGRKNFAPVELLIARFDSNGNNLWTNDYQSLTEDPELAFDIDYTSLGNIVVFATLVADGIGPNRIHVLLFTPGGTYVDGVYIININQSVLAGMVLDNDDLIIAGEREGQALAMQYTSAGVQTWELLDPDGVAFIGCEQTSDGGFAFAGSASPFGHTDFYVVKTDAAGTVEWSQNLDRPGNNYPKGMALGADDAIYTVGFTDIAVGNSNIELWALGKEERYSEYTIDMDVYTPGAVVPAEGGGLDFLVLLNNLTGAAQNVRLYREGYTPAQETIIIQQFPVVLQPGANPGFGTQYVPGYLDPGPYAFIFRLTTLDTDSLLATNSYVFHKLPPGGAAPDGPQFR